MDNNTLLLLLVIVLAIVIVAGFFLFRGRSKASIHAGPVSMNFEGASQAGGADSAKATAPPPLPAAADVQVTNAKSSTGGAYVTDDAGGSIRVDQVEVKDDIIVSRSDKTGAKDTSPKA